MNFFPSVTEDQLKQLIPGVRIQHYKKAETIYVEGENAECIFLVRDGHVRLIRIVPDGRALTLDIFNPGDIFGELVLAGQDQRTEFAQALHDCTLWSLPKAGLKAIIEQNPQMAMQITKIIGFRRLLIENKIGNLLATVPVRLARLLLLFADRYPGQNGGGQRYINLRLTHNEIGDLIAANREIVTSTLNRFRRDGLIDLTRNLLVLINEPAIAELAGSRTYQQAVH